MVDFDYDKFKEDFGDSLNKPYDYTGFEKEFIHYYFSVSSTVFDVFLSASGVSVQELYDNLDSYLKFEDEENSLTISSSHVESEFHLEAIKLVILMNAVLMTANMSAMLRALINSIEFLKRGDVQELINSDNFKHINPEKYFSLIGAKGASIKHASMKDLALFAVNLAQNYPIEKSANSIAHEIKEQVLQHSRTINANLTEYNAQDTIKKWINKERNLKKLGG